jgi:hypothetical protein
MGIRDQYARQQDEEDTVIRVITGSTVGALILCLCFATNASAGSISGAYNYSMSGFAADGNCPVPPSDGYRDYFQSTSGGNSIGVSDPVSFSICDGVPGLLAGGQFLIDSGSGDTLGGTFSGVFTGTSAGGGDIFDGTVIWGAASGHYSSLTDRTGVFEVVTGAVGTSAFTTGTFDFYSVPEPVTTALAGSGLLLLSLSRKLLKRRA